MSKNQTSDKTIDLFEIKSADKRRTRQSVIMQTWATLASLHYTEDDYDIWLMDMDIDALQIEKEVIAAAVESVAEVQKRFNEISEVRRRLRLIK